MNPTKSFNISKSAVYKAYKKVKANRGSAGIDRQSLIDFEQDLTNNLYKLWNRLSSGSYMPPPVKRVEIEKKTGGKRKLGVPTVSDRIAQMVVKQAIEPTIDPLFHPDSYGYRPNRSAAEALLKAKERCTYRAWVLDMDIQGFFDTIDHERLLLAVDRHVKEQWQRLYIRRWLRAPIEHHDGKQELPKRGTPQGGVISPLLANLFLHYVFDTWVERSWSGIQFERYADDIVCHCRTEYEAEQLKERLEKRFGECGLTLHPEKTKIVYCKSRYHRGDYKNITFDFLGYRFRPKWIKTRKGQSNLYFIAEISPTSAKEIRAKINAWPWSRWSQQELKDIRKFAYSRLNGWLHFYSTFGASSIRNVLFHFDKRLSRWAKKKYKRVKSIIQAAKRVERARKNYRNLFPHWDTRLLEMKRGWT